MLPRPQGGSNSFWNKPKVIKEYNSAAFEAEVEAYLAIKKQEYDNCKTRIGRFFTWYPLKQNFYNELKNLISAFDQTRGEKQREALLEKIEQGIDKFFGFASVSGFSEILRDWYFTLEAQKKSENDAPNAQLVVLSGLQKQQAELPSHQILVPQ